jgi:hypothetical protein
LRDTRHSSLAAGMIISLLAAQFAACGGGGDGSHVGPGGSDTGSGSGSGGGTGGGGPGTTGACGLSQATGVASPGPAEGAWTGWFPILSGVDIVFGNGVVASDGTAVFNVANSELWVGSVLASEDGAVASDLTRYERPNTGGAGGTLSTGTPIPEALVFDRASAHTTLGGAYQGWLSNCQDVSLGYDDVYERAASLQEIAGVYSTTEDIRSLSRYMTTASWTAAIQEAACLLAMSPFRTLQRTSTAPSPVLLPAAISTGITKDCYPCAYRRAAFRCSTSR